MQQDALRRKARQLRDEIRYHWPQLTLEDVAVFDGDRDSLATLLENRYEFSRTRAEREADWLLSQFEDRLRRAS